MFPILVQVGLGAIAGAGVVKNMLAPAPRGTPVQLPTVGVGRSAYGLGRVAPKDLWQVDTWSLGRMWWYSPSTGQVWTSTGQLYTNGVRSLPGLAYVSTTVPYVKYLGVFTPNSDGIWGQARGGRYYTFYPPRAAWMPTNLANIQAHINAGGAGSRATNGKWPPGLHAPQ